MPIRFDDGGGSNRGNDNRGGGKGGLLALLALLFMFWRFPKFTLFMLVLAGGAFYLYTNPEVSEEYFGFKLSDKVEALEEKIKSMYGTGCQFDAAQYDAVEVFEPLATDGTTQRPSSFSLLAQAPRRASQGQQGSCVGWATAYAARTIWEAAATRQKPNDIIYSPSYLYNLNRYNDACEGAILAQAMKFMKEEGLVYLSDFPYDESSCTRKPSSELRSKARNHRIRGFQRLTQSGSNYDVDMEAVKQYLAQGCPVTIGMNVPPSFDRVGTVWEPKSREYDRPSRYGGHAMCVIGYDDAYQGGAFLIMNSWGNNWGDKGCTWVRYNDFKAFTREAFGFYPYRDVKQAEIMDLEVSVGLVAFPGGADIPLKSINGQRFGPNKPLSKNDKFRLEVVNAQECYVYVFGEETDGSSYVLFPYSNKHSPFCGITGTRHFPKDGMESLRIDDQGSKDRMAVIVSRKPLDYQQLNRAISKASGTYEQKVLQALGRSHLRQARFRTGGGKAAFKGRAASETETSLAFIIEIDK